MSVRVELIVACSTNRVIGLNGQMPWHLPADLKHFKAVTMGSPVIMGRKTHESIGRPLPGRLNIVVSRNPAVQFAGCETVDSLTAAVKRASQDNPAKIFIIGGGQIYAQALHLCSSAWVTEIDAFCEGDAFFPELDPNVWERTVLSRVPATESAPALTFCRYDRRS